MFIYNEHLFGRDALVASFQLLTANCYPFI